MTCRRLKSFVVAVAVALVSPLVWAQAPGAGGASFAGKVTETMDAGQYTYVRVDDGTRQLWAAAPRFSVAVGDAVVVPAGMLMRDFKSETLHRTFPEIYFVSTITKAGTAAAAPHAGAGAPLASTDTGSNGGPGNHGARGNAQVDLSGITKAPGGQTVAELYAQKAALAGTPVAVRGRVVKFTRAVMGKNWIHVQDGSSDRDLTVSTAATARIGDLVLVRGTLGVDRDLGAGYRYEVIIENGNVAVE